jgi:hypothetical protein
LSNGQHRGKPQLPKGNFPLAFRAARFYFALPSVIHHIIKGASRMARISKQELVKLQKNLKTDAKIGAKFGITRQAVHQLRKKYAIESRTASNPLRNKKIVALHKTGKGVQTIAKQFQLSLPQTYRIIKETEGSKKKSKKK